MTLVDYLIENCQHNLSLLKVEVTNPAHADMIGKAADIIKTVKADRKREWEITGVRK
jgi:hypothetical protein